MIFSSEESFALKLDAKDELKSFRDQFYIPPTDHQKKSVYFCGNSLGLQPINAKDYVLQEIENWKLKGVKGHTEGGRPWFSYHELLTKFMSALVGGTSSEVVVMNSLTVNLHLLMVSFYRPTKERYKILIEEHAFPSDKYAMESQIRFHGFDPEDALVTISSNTGDTCLKTEQILECIHREKDSLALIFFGGVNYYTGQVFDMESITKAGHDIGSVVGFDLAHGTGNIFLKLHDWNVDFASWCGYKYLNGGPGAPAGVYIHDRYLGDNNLPRFEGWWGHDKNTRFKMPEKYIPIDTAEAWQLSNPPIFSMAPLLASLELFNEAGMKRLIEKSNRLTSYLEFLLDKEIGEAVEIITPSALNERGCQFSLRFKKNGKEIFKTLHQKGVIVDWREPDVIRIAPVPLYNSYHDIWEFINILKELM